MRRPLAILAIAALLASACSPTDAPPANRTLAVFAASSLTGAFTELGRAFEAENPGVHVTFVFGSSTDLAAQIASEGVADVFASASGTAMDALGGSVTDRRDVATNHLVVITPADDPAGVATFADLARPGVQVLLGAEGVPVGDYARTALTSAGILDAVLANVVSFEEDDASIVAKIAAGEADAAIVYASDLASAAGAGLRSVAVPSDVDVVAAYPIGIIEGSPNTDVAIAFVDFATGGAGQAILERNGFSAPA